MDLEKREKLLQQGRWLAIGHYIAGAVLGAIGLLAMPYIGIGVAVLTGLMPMNGQPGSPPPSPVAFGSVFLGVGVTLLVIIGTMAVITLYAGTCFSSLRHRKFLMVVQVMNLFHQPVGLILGIFGLIWLSNADVKLLFEEERASRAAPVGAPS
jgi:hypothetical protein